MRRTVAAVPILLACLALTACGDDSSARNMARVYGEYSIECVKVGGSPELSKPDGNNGTVFFTCKNGDNND